MEKGLIMGFTVCSRRNKKTGQEASMILLKKLVTLFGLLIIVMKKTSLSLNDADKIKAAAFLKERGFKDSEIFESTQYDNMCVFNFVTK